MNTAPNSPFKGYYPNINPFGISPRYNAGNMLSLYNKLSNNNDDITSSVKPIDKEKANIEAEKGEILLSFKETGLALHDIHGKPHSKGGTPLNVDDGSFIFSKDKSMGLSKEEVETFNLGKYAKGGLVNNTPAQILKRNIDLKHNNRMIDHLQNSKNYAEKTTAMKMLEKYQKTIGNIAALQEMRKPEAQIPQFAQLISKSPQIEQEEDRAEQYSKGGWVLPKAQFGINFNKKKPSYLTNQERLFQPFSPQAIQDAINSKLETPQLVEPKQSVLEQSTNNLFPTSNYAMKSDISSEVDSNTDLNIGEDFSWVKPYDKRPAQLSMLGNMAQYPKAFVPALPLQTPYRVREQLVDAQPGINAALASSYASRKANSQYAPAQLQSNQAIAAEATKLGQDYNSKIGQVNQEISTNVNNQNAQISNQVVNANNMQRGQYQDKLNELYQNVRDGRNQINATNLQILGDDMNKESNYNTQIDLMKKYQPWKVQSNMSQDDYAKVLAEFEKIQKPGGMDNPINYLLFQNMLKAKTKPSSEYETMSSMMNSLQRP